MLSDDELQDYIDDRLEPSRRATIAAQLLARPALAAQVDTLRRHNEALRAVGQEILDEPIPARLRQAVRRAAAAAHARHGRCSPRLLAAAVLLLVCLAGGHQPVTQIAAKSVGSCAPQAQVRAV